MIITMAPLWFCRYQPSNQQTACEGSSQSQREKNVGGDEK